jgi:hypothetical protein
MRRLVAALCLMLFASSAHGELRTRTVVGGKTTSMTVLTSWDVNCISISGYVKVLTKPQHGKLSNRVIDTTIPNSRFHDVPSNCYGKAIKGFEVLYTPEPGFHGKDTFTLDLIWAHHRATDTYTVIVE